MVFRFTFELRVMIKTVLMGLALAAVSFTANSVASDAVTSSLSGKPHSGGYNPHKKLTPEQLANVAILHIQEGRPNEAMAELNKAIVQYPTYAELFSVRGSLLLQSQKVTEALSDFETSLSLRPDDAKTLTNRAQAYRQFGRIEEALKDLDKALELEPDLLAARFNRGSIHYSSSDFNKALVDFEQCIALDPHTPAPYFNRASTYAALGQREEAIKDLERFIELVDKEEWRKVAEDLLKQWQRAKPASPGEPDQS